MQKQNFNTQLKNFLQTSTILSYDDEQIQIVNNNKRIILNFVNNKNSLQIVLQTNIDNNVTTLNTTKTINK